MRPSQIERMIVKASQEPEHPPIFLWGPPGVGKTAVVGSASHTAQATMMYRLMSVRDPVDVKGVPGLTADRKKSFFAPPVDLFPDNPQGKYFYFFDEITLANPATQAAIYQLITERRIEDERLPEHSLIILASNRLEDRAGVRDLASPFANRVIHINFDVDLDDWRNWAIVNNVAGEIIAFISLNADLLFKFDPQGDKRGFPTPRSIVRVDLILKTHQGEPYVWEMVEGAAGKEWAAKYRQYLAIYKDLPDVEGILQGKVQIVPVRSDLRFAIAALLGNKAMLEHLEAVMRYSLKLPPEHSLFLVQLLARRQGVRTQLLKAPSWGAWQKQHHEFVMPNGA